MNSSDSSPSEHKTEVWYGAENIINKLLEIMYSLEKQYDLCIPSNGPIAILAENSIREAYQDLKKRGVIVRIITDVTNDNIDNCEELSRIARFVIYPKSVAILLLQTESTLGLLQLQVKSIPILKN